MIRSQDSTLNFILVDGFSNENFDCFLACKSGHQQCLVGLLYILFEAWQSILLFPGYIQSRAVHLQMAAREPEELNYRESFFVVVVFFLVSFFFFKLEFSRCMCNALLLGSVVVQLGFLFFGRTSCCLFKESYSCHVKHNNLFVCLWRCATSSPNAPICCAAYLFGVRSLLRSKIWYASFRYVLLLSLYFFFILETNRLQAIRTSTRSRQVRADDWHKKRAGARRSAAGSPDPNFYSYGSQFCHVDMSPLLDAVRGPRPPSFGLNTFRKKKWA